MWWTGSFAVLPADWRVNVGIWILMVSAVVALQLYALRRKRLPNLGGFFRYVRRFWLLRLLLLGAWVWLGWHLFVRTTF